MSAERATVIGATGLIGTQLVALLQQDESFKSVRMLVRRPVGWKHPKLEIRLVDFSDMEAFKAAIDGSDVLFCAVGTTQKKVKGDQQAYRKVDYDIPVNAARFCTETDVQNFLLVSSVGANSRSGNFYLKLKGEVEEAVQQFPIRSISIFRPSILLGHRQEHRPGEKIGQAAMRLFSFALVGRWRKYKPISAKDVAKGMVNAAKIAKPGRFIYEYDEIPLSP